MIIDLGDARAVRYEARNPITFALTDVTAVLTVTDPSGATTTPSVTHTSTGVYDSTFTGSAVGLWRWKWAISGAITDVAYGDVTVADPAPTVYATLADLKVATGEIVDSTRDGLLQMALAAASRSIDQYCGRRFYADRVATARTFRTIGKTVYNADGEMLIIDDLSSAAGLIVEIGDGVAFSAVTDYFTEPVNALALGRPIEFLRRRRWLWSNSYWASRVRVTGLWGWPGVPDEVTQATLLLASRLFNRRKSPEGVTGNAEWGLVRVTRQDPDVASLIQPYQLMSVG